METKGQTERQKRNRDGTETKETSSKRQETESLKIRQDRETEIIATETNKTERKQ